MSHSQTGDGQTFDPFGLRTDQNRLNGGFLCLQLALLRNSMELNQETTI